MTLVTVIPQALWLLCQGDGHNGISGHCTALHCTHPPHLSLLIFSLRHILWCECLLLDCLFVQENVDKWINPHSLSPILLKSNVCNASSVSLIHRVISLSPYSCSSPLFLSFYANVLSHPVPLSRTCSHILHTHTQTHTNAYRSGGPLQIMTSSLVR